MKINVILISLVCFVTSHAFGQSELVKELNENIIELKTIAPDSSFTDLSRLNNILKGKQMVGLGEATHATSEFFIYKHRLIKYLVEEKGFRVFIIEGDYTGSKAMNDYVVHGNGTLRDGLVGMGYGIWCREEFVDLIKWFKTYNAGKTYKDKVKFYGCDINNEVYVANKLKAYLNKSGQLTETLKRGLTWIIDKEYRKKRSKGDADFKNSFLVELNDAFKSIENEKGIEEVFMNNCRREFEQILEMTFADRKTQIALRDKFMGENIEWIYDFENNQKAIFWAHNEHVKNDKVNSLQKPVGYYLKETFKDKYYSFGFGFNEGKVGGFNREVGKYDGFEVPEMSSKKLTDALFSQCAYPEFILDFKSTNANKTISKFLNTNLYQRAIGDGFHSKGTKSRHFRTGKLIDKYDGLIFIRKSTPPKQLK